MSEPNAAERRTETGAASADSDAQRRERILEALQLVNDPELGFSVIDLPPNPMVQQVNGYPRGAEACTDVQSGGVQHSLTYGWRFSDEGE